MKIDFMVKKILIVIIILIPLLIFTTFLYGYSIGPPDKHTRPPDTCTHCHKDFTLNAFNGEFRIIGVPQEYIPAKIYPIIVKIYQAGQRRWGFELQATSGSILVTDNTNTHLYGRKYLKQTSVGTYAGYTTGATWYFKWQAPTTGINTVLFYAAGNAANNDGSPSGDCIYTTIATTYCFIKKTAK